MPDAGRIQRTSEVEVQLVGRDAELLQTSIEGDEPTVQLAQSRLGTFALRRREVALAQGSFGVSSDGFDLSKNALNLCSKAAYFNLHKTIHDCSPTL